MKIKREVTMLSCVLLVGGCGGGGGGSGGGDAGATSTLSGVAAVGSPIMNGLVEARGANNLMVTSTTDEQGRYTISVETLTTPIIIRVKNGVYDDDDNSATPPIALPGHLRVYSMANGYGRHNVTSLTTLSISIASGISSVAMLFNDWGIPAMRPTQMQLESAAGVVRANFAGQFDLSSVSHKYNFFNEPFPSFGVGIDAVMDSIYCFAGGAASTSDFHVTCQVNGAAFPFNLAPANLSGYM